MNPILITTALTLSTLLIAAVLFGPPGITYAITAAGLPHFLVAAAFTCVSIRRGAAGRGSWLVALAVLSVAACLLYSRYPWFDLVGAVFVLHMFRDEVYMGLTRLTGFDGRRVEAALQGRESEAGLGGAGLAGRLFLPVGLSAFLIGRLALAQRTPAAEGLLSDPSVYLTGSVPLDLLVLTGVGLLLLTLRRAPARGRLALHLPPEARDLLILFVLVALAANLRQGTLFLALFHYVSWMLFYGERLRARAAPAGAGFWSAVMGRPAPFALLMVAAHALSFAGLALYLRGPALFHGLTWAYDLEAFPYWTIPHVILSLAPRR